MAVGLIDGGDVGGGDTEKTPAHAVSVCGLRKTYRAGAGRGGGEKTALHGLDLDVPQGCIFGLLGPNGAGKSTFINILSGMVVKSAGSVSIWGMDQDRRQRRARAAIGVVPQELTIDPFLTPFEAMEAQAGLYGVPRGARKSDELLEALGLGEKKNAYARALSGGMKRRLLVAKAMAHSPPVLVLDEPTAGVDLELRRSLWRYVGELNAAGVTVILTTHYLEEAEAMCDRIGIIDRGRLVAEAPTADLVASLDRKTVVLRCAGLEAAGAAARLMDRLPATATVSVRSDGAVAISYARKTTAAGAVLAAISASGVEVTDLATEEPHLEDAFLALTSGGGGA